jgi:hypothetical protein
MLQPLPLSWLPHPSQFLPGELYLQYSLTICLQINKYWSVATVQYSIGSIRSCTMTRLSRPPPTALPLMCRRFCYVVFNSHMFNASEVQLCKWCFHVKFLTFHEANTCVALPNAECNHNNRSDSAV